MTVVYIYLPFLVKGFCSLMAPSCHIIDHANQEDNHYLLKKSQVKTPKKTQVVYERNSRVRGRFKVPFSRVMLREVALAPSRIPREEWVLMLLVVEHGIRCTM